MGGSWARSVIQQCQSMGFDGEIWPVHPRHAQIEGLPCIASLSDLPRSPDVTFIGINRFQTIDAVSQLAAMGAGGAVCFASGFAEAAHEDRHALQLHAELLEAAATMPIIGPNCYGFINYLDGALLWPDQHGGTRVDSGVAFITQSSNIAINLTMQCRSLPISYVLTAGNQAQLSIGQLATATIEDERVTALALHIESYGDVAEFERMAIRAKELNKPVVAIKVGRSVQSQQAMLSHTNSISGSDTAASAFLERLGIARLNSIPALLETLKLVHVLGPLSSSTLQSMSCSGGEASLMSDAATDFELTFPPLSIDQSAELRQALGPLVALANPLDYHTFIWDDLDAMTATFTAMLRRSVGLNLLVLDFPRADRCDSRSWNTALAALIAARDATQSKVGIVATMPENLPEDVGAFLMRNKIVPLCGIEDAYTAIQSAVFLGCSEQPKTYRPVLRLAEQSGAVTSLDEASAKAVLADFSVRIPKSHSIDVAVSKSTTKALVDEILGAKLGFPVVLKGLGFAHKTESNAVVLGIQTPAQLQAALQQMPSQTSGVLVEEQIENVIAELLVSIVRDSTHGLQLTIAAGGVLTEMLSDARQLLLPYSEQDVKQALQHLKVNALLQGYRGQPAANQDAIVETVMALQTFALTHKNSLNELEINPLLCTKKDAIIVDALIRMTGE